MEALRQAFAEVPPSSVAGLNYSGMHDTALAIVTPEGVPMVAISLERISRVKQDGRPPTDLVDAVPWERIAAIGVSAPSAYAAPAVTESAVHPARLGQIRPSPLVHGPAFNAVLDSIPCRKVHLGHQEAHAASAFWGSGFDDALCLTYDGGMCNDPWFGGVFRCDRRTGIEPLDRFSAVHYARVTTLYTFVTALLGFIPNRHEGKVTGLAAYGQPSERCRGLLSRWFSDRYLEMEDALRWVFVYDDVEPAQFVPRSRRVESFAREFAGIEREELAASLQEFAEQHVLDILAAVRAQGWHAPRICLAGGLFANVKINQRVVESGFERLFVAPPMTDDGTALGAAWHVASAGVAFRPQRLTSMFLGPADGSDGARELVARDGLRVTAPDDPARAIAELLAQGKVVGVFRGAAEFGPRALGHRSVLAQATEKSINRTLNERLMRTEFMPFAPITRAEDAGDCYVGIERVAHPAEFMTVTVECTPLMHEACPGVVHIDGTARPQLVYADANPFLHQVLSHYHFLTGRPALVNTSFNIHEEPIVHTATDALRAFYESGLDYLYLDGAGLACYADNLEPAIRHLLQRARKPGERSRALGALSRLLSAECDDLEAELAEKEVEVARIAEKEEQIALLAAESTERQDMIDQLTAEAAERQRMIERLTAESQERLRTSAERLRLIERLHDEMAAREQQVRAASPTGTGYQVGVEAGTPPNRPNGPHSPAGDGTPADAHGALRDARAALEGLRRALVPDVVPPGSGGTQDALETRWNELAEALGRLEADVRALERTAWRLRAARHLRAGQGFVAAWIERLRIGLSPRLGRLHQHPRVPLRPPEPYAAATARELLPVISLVTPSFRQGAFIERTVLSVLGQEYPSLEYVVQDGGSDDETVSVLEKHSSRFAHWESRPDHGQADAINCGFARTTGEIMGWLNSDDLLLPGALACVGDFFARHRDVDVVYGNRVVINDADMEVGRWVLPAHDDEVLSWADFVPQETLFWRRSIWGKAGGRVDPSYEFALDWDMLVRFRAAGARFVHIPRFLAAFRVHPQQKTSAAIDNVGFAEMSRIRGRLHGRVPSDEEVRRAVRPYLVRHVVVHLLDSARTRVLGRR